MIDETKEKYKNTYANVLYHLINKIVFLEKQNKDLNKSILEMTIKLSYPEGF